ncbi:MAG: hypothetical protein ACE5I9_04890 [Candidatus Methylomirabilales bacterium]
MAYIEEERLKEWGWGVTAMRGQFLSLALIVGLAAGIPAPALSQGEPRGESQGSVQEKLDKGDRSVGSTAEDVALGAASVIVSTVQAPLRLAACGATFVVAGLAYLLTAFDREARQGPANAIETVCEGPYISSPEDLRGR